MSIYVFAFPKSFLLLRAAASVTRLWIKKVAIFYKSAQKCNHSHFHFKIDVFKMSQMPPNIWATFERKFATKNFQKSPNLVTLAAATFVDQ